MWEFTYFVYPSFVLRVFPPFRCILLVLGDSSSFVCIAVFGGYWGYIMQFFYCIIVFEDFQAPASSYTYYGCTFNERKVMLSLALLVFCWVWLGSLLNALFGFVVGTYRPLFLGLVSCQKELGIYCVSQTKGLCVTGLFELWQPQPPLVFSLVYDEDFLWQGLFETISVYLFLYLRVCDTGFYHHLSLPPVQLELLMFTMSCSSLLMARDHQVQPLWPMASPLQLYFLVLFWGSFYVGISISWQMLSTQLGFNLRLSLCRFAVNLMLFIEIICLEWIDCSKMLLGYAQFMLSLMYAMPLHQRSLCSGHLGHAMYKELGCYSLKFGRHFWGYSVCYLGCRSIMLYFGILFVQYSCYNLIQHFIFYSAGDYFATP